MKKNVLILIILWSFLWIGSLELSFAQSKVSQQSFDGYINNKIPINLSLTFEDNLVYGILTYTKVGQPIKVIGSLEKDDFLLHEFAAKADITGIYYGEKKGDEIKGSWSNPTGKEMPFSIKKTAVVAIEKPEVKSVTGSYAYSFGKDGGTGNLYVQQVGKDKIIVEMQAVKGPPSYNQAIITKTSLKLARNEAIYENKEFGKCKLKISFFEGGANIIYLDEAYECGFGNAASVVGSYLKFDTKAPKFEQN
ncbi:hypothetical protein [Emticicia sp. SJ17W-69]|uniref:hypothetical protein n=1 Tax=Emticicia sp. SJ17W-69 TaxID=3421657 RepID=UPI003EBEF9BC